jgi:hypothetical protein
MKKPHLSAKGNIKKPIPPSGVTDILPLPKKTGTDVSVTHAAEHPGARGSHNAATREEIQKTVHRTTPSRQSQRPVERSHQARKHHGRGSGPKR